MPINYCGIIKLWVVWRNWGYFNFQTTKETIEAAKHPLIIAERWHCILQTWQSAAILGRTACSCRSVCRTMGVCADFQPEQWQDDTEPDRHPQSRRSYAADRRGSFTEQQHCQKKLLIFLFPLSTSFTCFGTSGTRKSKVHNQTLGTTLWSEMSQ